MLPDNNGPAVRTRQAVRFPIPISLSSVATLSPKAKRFLEGLATVCDATAKTRDPNVAALGLALINRAPGELSSLIARGS